MHAHRQHWILYFGKVILIKSYFLDSYQWFPIILPFFFHRSYFLCVSGSQEDRVAIKSVCVTMELSLGMIITYADMCKHACTPTPTHTHTRSHTNTSFIDSERTKGTVKTCFDTDKGWGYFNQVHFRTCRTLKAKTPRAWAAEKETSFFSHLCQHSTLLSVSAGLAVNQKGVRSVRGFQPGWKCMQHSLTVWFPVAILCGWLQDELVPTSTHALLQQDQTCVMQWG